MKTLSIALLAILLYKSAITVSDYVHTKAFLSCLKKTPSVDACRGKFEYTTIEAAIYYQIDMLQYLLGRR